MARPSPPVFVVALSLAGGWAAPATGAPSDEIDELISQLPTRHWDAAVERLVEIGPPAVEALTAATREPGHVRGRACEALARIETGPALDVVHAAAGHPDPAVRWRAAWALGRIDGEAAAEALAAFEDDADWRVRNEVAAARERRVVDSVALYPATLEEEPEMVSPSTRRDGTEVVVAVTGEGEWAVVPAVGLDDERRERQRYVNAPDFPTLARTGLHSAQELARTVTITGRSLAEITDLGRPGGLSEDGFMAADEDVLSVLEGDNGLVSALGLTHPQMARPLFHVWNMIEADVEAGRWNHAEHRWDRIRQIAYNGRRVDLEAHDTKGGQESIFEDGLEGAFFIRIQREPTAEEDHLLDRSYGSLPEETWNAFLHRLTTIETGEMQPHYIQWYGFYEGHTGWRTDPIAIAFIFGLRSLEEIEAAFPGRLPEVLSAHLTRRPSNRERRLRLSCTACPSRPTTCFPSASTSRTPTLRGSSTTPTTSGSSSAPGRRFWTARAIPCARSPRGATGSSSTT